MKLGKILGGINFYADSELLKNEILDIKTKSDEVREGDLFIAMKGVNSDGNDFIADAFSRGAVAVLSDSKSGENIVQVDDARKAYSIASKNFFEKACDSLHIIAVTGTNGKTTTTSLIYEILKSSKIPVGLIGTEGVKFNGKKVETGFTTPDPYLLHKLFKNMKDEGIEYVIMEASAHAIALKKLEGIKFDIGILTNITEDHLDFFGDMGKYAKAKLDFFDNKNIKLGIVCYDDNYARSIIDKAGVPILSYGLSPNSDVHASEIKSEFDNTSFSCRCLDETFFIKTNLVGKYNIQNSLASIMACRALGVPAGLIQTNLRYIQAVEGRFNVIKYMGLNIVIDYAHTPDGIEKVIETAREITKNRVITLFGCGGTRDRQIRKIMGESASKNSDKVYVTSDNPRFEKPMDIINEIKEGLSGDYVICEDRATAIALALADCKEGDTLIIAGKGGEKYQDIMGVKHQYNDFDVVHNYFRNKFVEIKGGENDL